MNSEFFKANSSKKTLIQSKFYFSKTTQSTISKGKGKDISYLIPEKRKKLESNTIHEKVKVLKQKKPNLKDMLLDKNFEKLDEKYVRVLSLL